MTTDQQRWIAVTMTSTMVMGDGGDRRGAGVVVVVLHQNKHHNNHRCIDGMLVVIGEFKATRHDDTTKGLPVVLP